jgi:hypothetical protein
MSWLLLIPCLLLTVLVTGALVSIAARPWIRLPLFPLFNLKATQEAYRGLSRGGYAIVVGVFGWGWSCFFGITLSDYFDRVLLGGPVHNSSLSSAVWELAIWSLGGAMFGYAMRGSERREARK